MGQARSSLSHLSRHTVQNGPGCSRVTPQQQQPWLSRPSPHSNSSVTFGLAGGHPKVDIHIISSPKGTSFPSTVCAMHPPDCYTELALGKWKKIQKREIEINVYPFPALHYWQIAASNPANFFHSFSFYLVNNFVSSAMQRAPSTADLRKPGPSWI